MIEAALTAIDAASRLGLTARALLRSDAPRFKFGHRTVRFSMTDLESWAEGKRIAASAKPVAPSFRITVPAVTRGLSDLRSALVLPARAPR